MFLSIEVCVRSVYKIKKKYWKITILVWSFACLKQCQKSTTYNCMWGHSTKSSCTCTWHECWTVERNHQEQLNRTILTHNLSIFTTNETWLGLCVADTSLKTWDLANWMKYIILLCTNKSWNWPSRTSIQFIYWLMRYSFTHTLYPQPRSRFYFIIYISYILTHGIFYIRLHNAQRMRIWHLR